MKLGAISFFRNRLLSVAAVLVMTITLLIIASFAILNIVLNKSVAELQSKINLIVYFDKSAPEDKILALQSRLESESAVKEVHYTNRDAALQKYLSDHAGDPQKQKIVQLTGTNPLPASIEIKVDPPEQIGAVVAIVHSPSYQGILQASKSDSYSEDKATIDKLLEFTHFLIVAGVVASIIFMLIAVLVVFNTVKLTTFTRREEVEIMRLVGATESFVRLPFVVESLIYAACGTTFAALILIFSLRSLANSTKIGSLPVSYANQLNIYFSAHLVPILLIGLVISMFISGTCSYLAVRRSL